MKTILAVIFAILNVSIQPTINYAPVEGMLREIMRGIPDKMIYYSPCNTIDCGGLYYMPEYKAWQTISLTHKEPK